MCVPVPERFSLWTNVLAFCSSAEGHFFYSTVCTTTVVVWREDLACNPRTRNPVIVEKFACFIFCILQCHVDGCQGRSDYSIRHRFLLDRLLSASGGMAFTGGAHTYTVCHRMCFACPG
ncbi:unnamed protein product, partial [Ectocarpus sp. 13 AM-2016]